MNQQEQTNGFESVEIPASVMDELIVPAEQPGTSDESAGTGEAGAGGEQTEKTTGEETQPVKVRVKDAEYTEDEIALALEDSKNKTAWQKTNTEEAQRLAGIRKMVEPVLGFVQKLKDDGEFSTEIRDAAIERYGAEFAGVIDAAIAFDPEKAPSPDREELVKTKADLDALRAEIEANKVIQAEITDLRTAHGLSETQATDVLRYAEKRFDETGIALSLEDAFKLMDYENVKKKAETTRPAIPPVPRNQQGARDIKSKTAGSYADIKTEGYNLFE